MEVLKETEKLNEEKLSYEQLENVAHQLGEEYNKVVNKLKQAEAFINNINKLDYLLRIVELSDKFDTEFIVNCTEEIKKIFIESSKEDN